MATMKQVFGAMKKGLSTGNFTLNGLVQTLQNYCEQLENSTGGGGGSTVSYTQTATSGGECGTIDIDGNATKIYAPLQNASGVDYDNTSSGLTADDVQDAIDELNTKEGDLTDLTTTVKTSLVAAINEAAQGGGGGAALVDVTASITQEVTHDNFMAYTYGKMLILIGTITASVNNSTKILTLPASITPAISASTNFTGGMGVNGSTAIPTALRINTSREGYLVNGLAATVTSTSYTFIIPIQ